MKIDRLYAITVYLLNHGKTSGAELAKRFEVSVRTVQRDMDALCKAGIPVVAETGTTGGYYLTDTFHMNGHAATQADYSFILTALKGFSSAMNNPQIETTLEKLLAVTKDRNESIILDFSVLREGDEKLLQTLQDAIRIKHPIKFTYTNADNHTCIHTVEPIAAVYRWYAWYLLAYSITKNDYRTYKLVRMNCVEIVNAPFTKEHDSAEAILHENDKKLSQAYTEIIVRCKPKARARVIEYLNGNIISEHANGECEMTLYVVENELFWFGTLLSLGDEIQIIEPDYIRLRVLDAARKIICLYDEL